MYTIDKTEYGLRVVMSGILSVYEISQFSEELREINEKFEGHFSMLVDVRTVATPSDKITELFRISQLIVKEKLMRMVIIVASPVVQGMAKQLGFRTGINDVTRIINSLSVTNWEEVGMNWIINGVEPDQNKLMTDIPHKMLADLLK